MARLVIVLVSLCLLLVLASGNVFAQATFDTLTIHQLQYVPDPVTNDDSPYLGDTVVVKGLVMHGIRDIYVGARWAIHIVDPDSSSNPWSGFFIIQNDTSQLNTLFDQLVPGDIAYFTGHVEEFSHFSQVNIYGSGYFPNPPIPVSLVSGGNPLPNAVPVTALELQNRATAEQWESMFVKVNDATVVNSSISGNWASIDDPSGGLTYMAEYFYWFYNRLNNGTYDWPSNGTNLNVQGFVRDESGSPGQVYTVNPRDTFDIDILTNPPQISNVLRDPGVPTSSDNVDVTATIVDNGSVQSATLNYSINEAPFQQVAMTATQDTFSATIPSQSDGAFVRYFISALDNVGEGSTQPGDTSHATGAVYFYTVRDAGLSIADVQNTHGYKIDDSGYRGYEVTLQGIINTDTSDFIGDYYMQDAAAMWSGIWVNGNPSDPNTYSKGDEVSFTGTIEENFNVTRINVTSSQLVNAGVGAYAPIDVTTGEINSTGANAEAYESVLIKVSNVTVTDPFPDAPGNYGEFEIDDGSGPLRVDDGPQSGPRPTGSFLGNLDSTFGLGDQIDAVIALGYYSFSNYKVQPRDSNDIIGHHPVGIKDNELPIPRNFALRQNYPNPFNPSTDIEYNIAASGNFTINIYNILGQKVRTLVNARHSAGNYKVRWDGTDDSGRQVGSGIYFYSLKGKDVSLTKKMILLK